MMHTIKILILFFVSSSISIGQEMESGGGEIPIEKGQCLTSDQHKYLIEEIHKKLQFVKQSGILDLNKTPKNQKLIWPVKQIENYPDPSIQGVSNFVDHDTTFFTQGVQTTLDYNCETRTYDIENYNHAGTDIFLYPFSWKLMRDEVADVVAAKDGFILSKIDNNYDLNCEFCTNCSWNAIYILHDDNTVSIYGHLKTGTLTNQPEFSDVKQGDFLGKVGSSGFSSGPHLHFEILDIEDNVIDPFIGVCNTEISESLWETQRPYNVPMINALKTSTAPPLFAKCPEDIEDSFEKRIFQPEDKIVLTAYLTDQKKSSNLNLKIINPNGAQVANFNQTLADNYISSYWYWTVKINQNAIAGDYILRGTYMTQVVDYIFSVYSPTSTEEISSQQSWITYTNNEIELDIHDDEQVLLFDITGKLISSIKTKYDENLKNIPPGYYTAVLIKNSIAAKSKKLVIW